MSEDLYAQMKQSVVDGEDDLAAELAQKGLDAGLPPADILDKGFVKGIEEVGDLFGRGEFFLPELVQGAEAMKAAVAVLQPELDKAKDVYRVKVLGELRPQIGVGRRGAEAAAAAAPASHAA